MIIQIFLLLFFFRLDAWHAITDSMVVTLLHALLGLAIWYPVRFNPLTSNNILGPLFNILATGMLAVLVWVGLSYLVLSGLFSGDQDYLVFLQKSIPSRIITDILIFALLVLVYSLIVYSTNLKEKIDNESSLKTLVREAELNMLKSQINPHFLFNSLNSISHLVKKDPERARGMIVKLSDFLRFSLKYGDDETVILGEELENMQRYLEIEKIRFGDKLLYNTYVDQGAKDCRIPNMILQPLLENAIKHGVYESTVPIKIDLSIRKKERILEISISNDFDPGRIALKGAGIGLKNITDRLRLLYGRMDLLDIKPEGNIFRVHLYIPQKSDIYHDKSHNN